MIIAHMASMCRARGHVAEMYNESSEQATAGAQSDAPRGSSSASAERRAPPIAASRQTDRPTDRQLHSDTAIESQTVERTAHSVSSGAPNRQLTHSKSLEVFILLNVLRFLSSLHKQTWQIIATNTFYEYCWICAPAEFSYYFSKIFKIFSILVKIYV